MLGFRSTGKEVRHGPARGLRPFSLRGLSTTVVAEEMMRGTRSGPWSLTESATRRVDSKINARHTDAEEAEVVVNRTELQRTPS